MGKFQAAFFTFIFALLFITSINLSAHAQEPDKKAPEKTTTIDTWRQAMPQSEQPVAPPTPASGRSQAANGESPAQTRQLILDLESKFMAALKQRDASTLDILLGADFVPAGFTLTAGTDKQHFVDWALKSFQLKTYTVDKTKIRVYPGAAISTSNLKRQASIGEVAADGDFLVTNVWIKRDDQWRLVSHQINQIPKS